MPIIDTKLVTIKVRDGGSNELTIKLGEGTLTYSEKVDRQYFKDRGILDSVRNGDEQPMEVSLDSVWEFITSNGATTTPTPTLEDVLKRRGAASAWVSVSDDVCQPYAVDIAIIYDPECAGTYGEDVVLPEFRYESIDHDIKAGTIKLTGKCNATEAVPTRTHTTT